MANIQYQYYVAYVAQAKNGGIVFGNESVWLNENLTIMHMDEIRECIAKRRGFNQITILNIIKL